jgi:hypothetical protein
MSNLWSPQNVVMGLVLSVVAWLSVELFSVNKAVAIQATEQKYNNEVRVAVKQLVPMMQQINDRTDNIECMLRYQPNETAERLACLTKTRIR